MKNRTRVFLLLSFLLISISLSAEVRQRPANWAQPVIGAGLDNCYKLDEHVYRAERPTRERFKALKGFGLKAVLNLEEYHDDTGRGKDLGLKFYRYKINAAHITYADLVAALRIIKHEPGPILIHCQHGSDRTGAVAAGYRIAFQNWSKEAALDELQNGGYGFHAVFRNIPQLIQGLDVERFRRDVLE